MQIQALLVAMGERGAGAIERPNAEANIEVTKLPIFSREEVRNIAEFIIVYKR